MGKERKLANDFKRVIGNTSLMMRYINNEKSGKTYFAFKFIQSISLPLLNLALMTLPGLLINELIQELPSVSNLVIMIALITVIPLISYLLNLLLNYHLKKIKLQIISEINIKFYKHSCLLDYASFDSPEMQIKKERSLSALSNVWSVSDSVFALFSHLINLVTIVSIILILNPFILAISVLCAFLVALVKKRANKLLLEIDKKGTEIDRKRWGIVYMLEQRNYAKEIRLFDLSDLLTKLYKNNMDESNSNTMQYFTEQCKPMTLESMLEFIQQTLVYTYLVVRVVSKSLLIGSFTIYIAYYSKFRSTLNGFLSSFMEISRASLNIDELNEFMSIPLLQIESGQKDIDVSEPFEFEFKNVSFMYPGTDSYAIKDLNIRISSNEKLCIVGENGAGKSTFIKLLMRLYDPTEGEILFNGINVKDFDYKKYLKLFSPVFQDFVKFFLSLGINITLSDCVDKRRLNTVTKKSGLISLVNKLPKGYDTQIGKWIDPEGIEPSGGEAQRIAIARALYHGGQVFILDEPTAALDPNAEYEIYTQFHNMIQGKTAIIITHRLSAVQLADKVAVFDNGYLSEYGTHKELYAKGGKYKEMFDKQSSFYVNSGDNNHVGN